MSALPRDAVKALVPAAVRRWWRRRFGWRWMRGDYGSWAEAQAAAGPRRPDAPVARVVAAARAVRAGRAAWERDGVLFPEEAVHAPLLGALRAVAADAGGQLDVVDFGGGLGSTWWQHRQALADLAEVKWRIVELPPLVAAGRSEFAGAVLSFHESVAEACAGERPAAILFSSVLQYMEKPHALLADVVARGFQHVVIDRVGFVNGGRDRLAVQYTPPQLGGGAGPCWLFARERLIAPLARDYDLVAEWPVAFDQMDGVADYHGLHFRRRDAPALPRDHHP